MCPLHTSRGVHYFTKVLLPDPVVPGEDGCAQWGDPAWTIHGVSTLPKSTCRMHSVTKLILVIRFLVRPRSTRFVTKIWLSIQSMKLLLPNLSRAISRCNFPGGRSLYLVVIVSCIVILLFDPASGSNHRKNMLLPLNQLCHHPLLCHLHRYEDECIAVEQHLLLVVGTHHESIGLHFHVPDHFTDRVIHFHVRCAIERQLPAIQVQRLVRIFHHLMVLYRVFVCALDSRLGLSTLPLKAIPGRAVSFFIGQSCTI